MVERLQKLRPHLPLAGMFLALAVVYALLAHLNYWPSRFRHKPIGRDGRPVVGWELEDKLRLTSGDEPHYMVIINTLYFDHDLRMEDDYARVHAGGVEAGVIHRHEDIGGHAILFNTKTRKHDFCVVACTDKDYARVGGAPEDFVQLPSHPIGHAAILAALAVPFRPTKLEIESLVGHFNIVFSILGIILTYFAAKSSGLAKGPSIAVTLLVALASPWMPYVRSYFAETMIGVALLVAYIAHRSHRQVLAGIAIGFAATMKPVVVVFAFSWFVQQVIEKRWREALWFGASTGVCGIAILVFNLTTLHVPFTTGAVPYYPPDGLSTFKETLAHPRQGLLLFMPWAIVPLLWGPLSARPGARDAPGRLALSARRQIVGPMLLSLVTFSAVGWGAGYCSGPRYWVPLLPYMAMLTIDFVMAGRWWRWVGVGALAALSAVYAFCSTVQYHWIFSQPPSALIQGPSGDDAI